MNLYPSILTASIEEYQHQLDLVKESDLVKTVQVDIVDGYFTDNLTLSPIDLLAADHGDLEIDLHLMVEEPLSFIFEILEFKEELPIRGVIAQIERMTSLAAFVAEVRVHNWQVGLSLDLYTPIEEISPELWSEINLIQLMTIKAGFQGQKFNPNALEKIAEIKQLAEDDIEIIVDGGVKLDQSTLLSESGVGGVAVGSGIWQAEDPVLALQQYSQLMK